jgi:hypothetical protein
MFDGSKQAIFKFSGCGKCEAGAGGVYLSPGKLGPTTLRVNPQTRLATGREHSSFLPSTPRWLFHSNYVAVMPVSKHSAARGD